MVLLLFHRLRDGHEIATVRTHVRHGVPTQHRHGEDGKAEGVQLTTLKRSVTECYINGTFYLSMVFFLTEIFRWYFPLTVFFRCDVPNFPFN